VSVGTDGVTYANKGLMLAVLQSTFASTTTTIIIIITNNNNNNNNNNTRSIIIPYNITLTTTNSI
jgi:hypothetical protein